MTPNTLEVCLIKQSEDDFFTEIAVGRFARISFNRTLRIPEDGRNYPLPAGLGRLPIHRVEEYADKVPEKWLLEGGFFMPLYQKEALYIEFEGADWHPNIAKVFVGKINAITGNPYSDKLSHSKQDYVVIPNQRWLDGICSAEGRVKQFVAMPLGQGYTIEAQITDEEIHGGFQLLIFDAVSGRFPERDPAIDALIEKIKKARMLGLNDEHFLDYEDIDLYFSVFGKELKTSIRYQTNHEPPIGIAAGGNIEQMIIADTYGIDSWDHNRKKSLTIHLVNSLFYKEITGNEPPPSPITKLKYEDFGIPWFSFYDEKSPLVAGAPSFKRILGVSEIANRRGEPLDDSKFKANIQPISIKKIATPDAAVAAESFRSRAYESAAISKWEWALSDISNAIDISEEKKASDYALRCCCNYHLENFFDAEIDGSLALEIDRDSNDARSWRAYSRLAIGDYDGLYEDANILITMPETAVFGFELRANAAMLSGKHQDAIDNALNIIRLDANNPRAELIIKQARSMVIQ